MKFPRVHIWHWKSRRWPGIWADRDTQATYLAMQGDYFVLIERPQP